MWAIIEASMETIILGMYEVNMDRGLVLTANIPFNSRLDLLRIIANNGVDDDVLAQKFNTVLGKIQELHGQRNKMVHGLWRLTDHPGKVRRLGVRARGKKVVASAEDFTASDLWKVVSDIASTREELMSVADELGIDAKLKSSLPHSKTKRT